MANAAIFLARIYEANIPAYSCLFDRHPTGCCIKALLFCNRCNLDLDKLFTALALPPAGLILLPKASTTVIPGGCHGSTVCQ